MARRKTNKLNLLATDALADAAECLKVMAHPARLRIADILMQGDFAVHELSDMLDLAPHQTCEHLRRMQARGLLASERHGRAVHYSIVHPRLSALIKCIRNTCG